MTNIIQPSQARIGGIVQASNQRGAQAVGTLLGVTDGVWGYGGDAVALELDAKDDRGLRHWPAGMCTTEAN